jgi:hypothetical protein
VVTYGVLADRGGWAGDRRALWPESWCGLGARLALYLAPGARARIDAATAQLGPGLRELIGGTQAAVGAALLAHRI